MEYTEEMNKLAESSRQVIENTNIGLAVMMSGLGLRNKTVFSISCRTYGSIEQFGSDGKSILGNSIQLYFEDGQLALNIGTTGTFRPDSDRAEIYKILGFLIQNEGAMKLIESAFITYNNTSREIFRLGMAQQGVKID